MLHKVVHRTIRGFSTGPVRVQILEFYTLQRNQYVYGENQDQSTRGVSRFRTEPHELLNPYYPTRSLSLRDRPRFAGHVFHKEVNHYYGATCDRVK
eukprot:1713884-Pyramimonas_sp.AAC.1